MDLKLHATRIVGYVALILGSAYFVLSIFALSSIRMFSPWTTGGAPLLIHLLSVMAAGNLIYVGWHAFARGTIPFRPRPFISRRNLVHVKAALASAKRASAYADKNVISVVVALIFAGCGYAAAQLSVHYNANLRPGQGFPWLVWLVEFPLAMALALIMARVLGVLQRPRLGSLLAGVVTIFMANIAAVGTFVVFLPVVYYLAFIPALLVNGFVLLLAQVILNDTPEALGTTSRSLTRFINRALWAGFPIGLATACAISLFFRNSDWFVPSIQITWGTMLGLSLVQVDATAVPNPHAPSSPSRLS